MKAKKLAALLLALAMSSSVMAVCGTTVHAEESNGVTFPLEEPVTFTVAVVTGNEYVLEDSVVMKKMEEKTNVHFEYIYIPVSESAEKLSLLLNSGDYPDLFLKCNMNGNHYDGGMFVALEDMIREYAPNYAAHMDSYDAWKITTHSDGHTYSLGEIEPNSYMQPNMYINETWLENLGLKKPTTWDEFYEVLKAFKEQDANGNGDPDDEIPFLVCSYWDKLWNIANYYGFVRQGHDANTWALNDAGDEVYFWPTSDMGKEIFSFLKKLYDEGLLYNDTFVSTYEQTAALGQSGDIAGVTIGWSAGEMVGDSRNGGHSDAYDILEPFGGNKFPARWGIEQGTFCITDACEYPEIALAWADILYTEEGGNWAMLGEEGVTYEVTEDGSWRYIKDGEYGEDPLASATIAQGGGVSYPILYTNRYLFEQYVDPEDISAVKSAAAKERIMNEYTMDKTFPTLTLTEDENETCATIGADCDPYWKQYAAKVITGEEDLEATWDEYLQTMDEMGLSEMEGIYNDALKRVQ